MIMKKWISLIAVLALVFSLTACGGGSSEPEGTEEDGQNPVMNYIGNYAYDRANILIEADGMEGARATVSWGSSAWETAEWVMSGTFDSESLKFEYSDCVKTVLTYGDDGEVASQEEVYTGGHGSMQFSDDPLSLTWQDDEENIADGTTFQYIGSVGENSGEESEPSVGIANPWSDVDSAEAAAEGAGLDTFDVPDGITISLGEVNVDQYRCMEGLAEAKIPIAAVEMTIRKGLADPTLEVGPGDISGDYNEYKYNWTQNIKGLEVNCFGNREGEATKTIWSVDGHDYSILALGAGGDEDFGLSPDDLNSLINAIQ
jgi:hypothetical protein